MSHPEPRAAAIVVDDSVGVDAVVVGAGVVGLACAGALARSGVEVVILEAADAFGTGVSSRSSEVVHAGLYYPPGSLRARLCVEGRRRLVEYAASHRVPLRRCGKFVVAGVDEPAAELAALDAIEANARACGVDDLRRMTPAEVAAVEPELRCAGALWSPSSGIVDSHALMASLLGDAERAGAVLALRSPVRGVHVEGAGDATRLAVDVGGAEPMRLVARRLVNAAGLGAVALARAIDGLDAAHVPPMHLARGDYFALASGRVPFTRLVYPVPGAAGRAGHLGVHLTLDLGGQARFGPGFEWIDAVDFGVDASQADAVAAGVRRWWPGLPDGALVPAWAGVRPKISGPGEPAADFRIDGPAVHGLGGLVNLFGIESPGLTASLAIADEVMRRLDD